ncbi:MAG: DMT family transporter [Acidobacteriota bacterium]
MIGEAACLSAALCWAFAVIWFRRPIAEHGPWSVNLAKITLATVFLGATALALGQGSSLGGASTRDLLLIAGSGILGLTLGDTALFAAVDRLGAHRTLLFQTFGPVFAAALAFAIYDERLRAGQWLGAALVLVGVAVAVWTPDSGPGAAFSPTGAGLALLAAFGQGSGVVLVKDGMSDLPVVAASFLRLGAAALGLALVMAVTGRLGQALRLARPGPALGRILGPTLLGTYVAFLLMMAGIALAPASVAAVLLATSPIFSLFVEAKVLGTPITRNGLVGTVLAIVGVGLLSTL